jgi:hypothetical protein
MGDIITDLPTDSEPFSPSEKQLADSYFEEAFTNTEKLLDNSKDYVLLLCLYIVVSLPFSNDLIKKFFPSSSSDYMNILIK